MFVEQTIATIDELIGRQLDAILHHPEFQALEQAWRGLKFVVDRVDRGNDIQTWLWSCSRRVSIERTLSDFHHFVYEAEYGQHGGKPYTAVFACFPITPSNADLGLLRGLASTCMMAHVPIFVDAAPSI